MREQDEYDCPWGQLSQVWRV